MCCFGLQRGESKKRIEYLGDELSSWVDEYEVILVDEGCTDKFGDIIDEIIKQKNVSEYCIMELI